MWHVNRKVAFCFNRKEAKDHGEGGMLIGQRLQENETVVIIEGVTASRPRSITRSLTRET